MYKMIDNYEIYSNGDIKRNGKILKQQVNNKGYKYVNFSINGKLTKKLIHRLVAQAFIPNPYNLPQVNHIDGNKSNNNIENLEWCDNKYNQIHAIKIGLKKKTPLGDKNKKAKKVKMIDKNGEYKIFGSLRSAVEYLNKEYKYYSSISHCCKGDTKTAYGYKWEYIED